MYSQVNFFSENFIVARVNFTSLFTYMYYIHWACMHVGMMSSGFGHIVVIDSVLGKFGTKGKSSLAAAKFGVLGMMDSLQCEVV